MTAGTAALPTDMASVRRMIGRHIVGTGVELGPGHQPFPLPYPGVTVSYVDRWEPAENRALFVELGGEAPFRAPDLVCNLDTDRLGPLDDESQDFVIASHVLEHVADPLGLLDEIHRVLRPGAVALVLLPDMRHTFDHLRPVTSLEHLVGEFEAGVTEVDDEHIRQFLEFTEDDYHQVVVDADPTERARLFEWHRRRSIHVHCWTEHDFPPVIHHAIAVLGHRWEFVDGVLTADEGPEGIEFGYVMQRSPVDRAPDVRLARFIATFDAWVEYRRLVHDALDVARRDGIRPPEAAPAAPSPPLPEPGFAPGPRDPVPVTAAAGGTPTRIRRLAGRVRGALQDAR